MASFIRLEKNFEHKIRICLIGAGGSGSEMAYGLARMDSAIKALGYAGIEVFCYDHDFVSESNLVRQSFFYPQLNLNKAETLIAQINRQFGLSWKAFNRKFDEEFNSMENFIYINCSDSIQVRKILSQKIPKKWLDLGNDYNYGQFVYGQRDCKNIIQLYPEILKQTEDTSNSCSSAEALMKQDFMINKILVDISLHFLWELITKEQIDYHGAFVNLETLTITKILIEENGIK